MTADLVVDAYVAIKWFIPEEHASAASAWLESGLKLTVPELFWPECGSVFKKKVIDLELTQSEVFSIQAQLHRQDLLSIPHRPLMSRVLKMALDNSITVYDATYLALAETLSGRMVTADRKLYDKLSGKQDAKYIVWVEDTPSIL